MFFLLMLGCHEPPTSGIDPQRSVQISPRNVELTLSDTIRLSATVRRADGTVVTDQVVTWSSTATDYAIVDSTGLLRGGRRSGTAIIRATAGDASDTMTVHLTATIPLEVWPDQNLLLPGMSRLLVARTQNEDGTVRPVSDVRWSSDDPNIVRVDSVGRITAVSLGRVVVTATSPTRTARAVVNVTQYDRPLRFTAIVAPTLFSYANACALTTEGSVYCWGTNSSLALGTDRELDRCENPYNYGRFTERGRERCSALPVRVNVPEPLAGIDNHCGWTAAGTVYCWGSTPLGRTDGQPFIAPVPGGLAFTAVDRNCGITVDHLLYCWQYNTASQAPPPIAMPIAAAGNLRWSAITVREFDTCGLTVEGQAYCWGWNPNDRLAIGPEASTAPLPVKTDQRFVSITASDNFFHCGLTAEGRLYCWGGSYTVPAISVTLVETDVRLAAPLTRGTPCGLSAAGEVYCVGMALAATDTPTFRLSQLFPGRTFRSGTFGPNYGCGIGTDDIAYCSGAGWLGDGTLPTVLAGYPPTLLVKVAGQD